MATSAEELTECVVCAATFTSPQVLLCNHTFCKDCVNRLTQAGIVKCPICKQECLRNQVKPDFRLATFLDVLADQAVNLTGPRNADVIANTVTLCKSEKCEACNENDVDCYCDQCEQWFCTACMKTHSNMKASKSHTYTTFVEKSEQVMHEVKHRMQNLQVKTEELLSAAAQNAKTMAEIEATQAQAKQTNQQLRAALHVDVDKYFDDNDERIDSFCLQKLKYVYELKREKEKQIDKITAEIDKLWKQHGSKTFAEANKILSKSQELIKSLDDVTDVGVDISPHVSLKRNEHWSLTGVVNLQLHHGGVPTLKIRKTYGAVEHIQRLSEATKKQWIKQSHATLKYNVNTVRVINQQLWCSSGRNGIVMLNHSDLKYIGTLPADRMEVHDVAELPDWNIVIASDQGLFQARINGRINFCINPAKFTSVVVHHHTIYAAGWSEYCKVYIYKQSGGYWVKIRSFGVAAEDWITLSVKNNQIKCCSHMDSSISVFSLKGELLQRYGYRGSGGAGNFHSPYICSDDDDGSVLIADSRNNRLQVMSEQGKFRVLQLQPPVSEDCDALLFNNKLYVVFNNNTINTYV